MDAREVREALDDRTELEDALREVQAVDEERDTWTFDDVPLDSGAFGELVGARIVQSAGDEYRLADPEAVERALAGNVADEAEPSSREFSLPEIDRKAAGALAGLLALVALVRASTYPSVFRDRVVFSANDPYYYVYFVEQTLADGGWSLGGLPDAMATGEPLTFVTMLLSVELFGGLGGHQAILAWLPVVAAVATATALYGLACEVCGDRRIALASVLVLAVLPVHVSRSSLGFVDHHAFDYVWLTITAWGVVATFDLDSLEPEWPTYRAIAILAVGVAGSVLSWFAAALLLFPIAISVALAGALSIRDDTDFFAPGTATAVGVGAGALVIAVAHVAFGWHDTVIVGVPIVLTLGTLGVVGLTDVWQRYDLPAWSFLGAGFSAVGAVTAAIYVLAPSAWIRISQQVSRLFGDEEIVEVKSLFGAETMGWLLQFGLLFFFAIPAMAWAVFRAYQSDRRWLVAGSYAWFLLGLAALQSRYAGEFAPFGALFAGLALVVLAERVDAARAPVPFDNTVDWSPSMPSRAVAMRLAVVVLLVCGLSAVLAPVNANNITIEEEQYETAVFLDNHAAEAGYEYPESYVFSPWSWNRMYNYHVNGEAASYGYARSVYNPFIFTENPEQAYSQIQGGPADNAYIVTEPVPGDPQLTPEMMQSRLQDNLGSRGNGTEGLSHYRALYVSPSGDYKAFRVVPGATIRGNASAGTTVTVEIPVDIEGASFTYERQTTANSSGVYAVTVPYPGEYSIEGANATSVTVAESDVRDGATVRAS
ncbi:MAG: dolichyl-diphosphooligosaccharide--protein glycosyltransferase [Natronomonas sp.]|jgi:dolichyl-diphosphooligosaccharide--protein glycosyltransferase|uniref:hypothetical protein n=1 Tax=Natronomonas sp. TaxID=2184060 RepID=UPI003989A755